ncbi:hypothetical protein BDV41DRAFT_574402 [Aspergillus transmontanensis]|uniref:Uncharacterized protein n=1 Tax=Aspergillus transmontanensis TaxID=1034304 RepID=A0A5N6W5B3_9EURO|nr:hypothetical protein BDV41DRAFT_574402 [Aspergillus transmontanensis]
MSRPTYGTRGGRTASPRPAGTSTGQRIECRTGSRKDASEPSELRRVVIKYMRKGYGIFDSQIRALTAQTCFERVTSDGTNVMHLAPEWEVVRERQDRKQTINVAEANECTNASMAAQNVWQQGC